MTDSDNGEVSQNSAPQTDHHHTELGAWLISLHSVNVEESSFGAKVRLIFRFNVDVQNLPEPFKTAGNRTYYRPSDMAEHLPGQAIEIINRLTGGIVPTNFYAGQPEKGLLFHEAGQSEGALVLEQVYEERFKQVFDLRKFPYEADELTIDFVLWCANEADFQRDWSVSSAKNQSPGGDRLDLPDFNVGEFGLDRDSMGSAEKNVRCNYKVLIKRRPWYYFISSTLSMAIIMLFSVVTFGISGEDNGSALGIVGSLLLATIAVRFVISQDTPRVPYMTCIDKEALATFLFLLFVAFLHTEFNSFLVGPEQIYFAFGGFSLVAVIMAAPLARYLFRRTGD
ncbi:hypothetical protein ILP92_04420 [Maribius pontilimi]|uniref:Uncharacterized protein n=1 Tax=Palleronia pontilimi TaxID=1964209 RepID=A0A934IG69_9RHOB|nr:hypothetical protein [Palleronia pontilimi]MBJ3761990.1 hypothetical protein [Palleronia pontilimi]